MVVHFLPRALAVAARDRVKDAVVGACHVELCPAVGGQELAGYITGLKITLLSATVLLALAAAASVTLHPSRRPPP